jgi:hypothetical protein
MKKIIFIGLTFLIIIPVIVSAKGKTSVVKSNNSKTNKVTKIKKNEIKSTKVKFSKPATSKVTLFSEIGFGNLVSIYGTYKIAEKHSIGIGVGYIYYKNYDTDAVINVVEPAVIWHTEIMNIFVIRGRFGVDLIGRNGESFRKTGYTITPDFMIKVFRFKMSSMYAGVSLPFVIGTEGVDMDTVIGAGYEVKF